MRFRLSGPLAMVASLTGFASCSGGGGTTGQAVATACSGTVTNTVCLDGCSLGCRGTTCEITNIAQNENIVLRFSSAMDPRFINESTIQFRTASGEQPVGDYITNGQVVEFVPKVLTVGSQSFFGFRAGETYTMTLPGGLSEPNAARSTSGDPLRETISCTLRVTNGIVDLNQVPPSACLIVPTAASGVALGSLIQIGFNELVDSAPFQQTGADSPVSFQVLRTQDAGGGVRVCTTQATPLAGQMRLDLLPELPNVAPCGRIGALLTFTPSSPLPGSSCVRITVTDRVKDLSGRSAEVQTFEFQTVVLPTVEDSVTEEFDNDAALDAAVSAGTWNAGRATFADIGGDGRHGAFNPTDAALAGAVTDLGTISGLRTYRLDTGNTVIPGSRTITGTQATIADGRYFFSEFVVPAGTRLLFAGTLPPQITVRGRIQIDGTIDVNGESLTWPSTTSAPNATNPNDPLWLGQLGGRGGIFGGAGGNGGRRCTGLGPSLPAGVENGSNGQDCRVPAGHAFAAQVVGTGGRGATMFPAHGVSAQISYPPVTTTSAYAMEASAGGSGGGLVAPGGGGRVVTNLQPPPPATGAPRLDFMGPPTAGGSALALLPVPVGARSSLHFLVGGSGGGGGSSQPSLLLQALSANPPGRIWSPGAGGGGGGGALALRAGKALRVSATGKVLARGGAGAVSPLTTSVFAQPGPAGGGSGGSIVLQSGETVQLVGELNVLGGTRGQLNSSSPSSSPPPYGGRLHTEGGDGSPGILRLERPGVPSTGDLPNAQPAATQDSVAVLSERDQRVGFQSQFYSTRQPFGPEFVRYEIRAIIDGVPIVFSDDPAIGIPARAGFGPLEVFFQGATMDLSTGAVDPLDIQERPWRSLVGGASGLAADARNAFRFLLILDRTNGQTVEIDSIKVVFRV